MYWPLMKREKWTARLKCTGEYPNDVFKKWGHLVVLVELEPKSRRKAWKRCWLRSDGRKLLPMFWKSAEWFFAHEPHKIKELNAVINSWRFLLPGPTAEASVPRFNFRGFRVEVARGGPQTPWWDVRVVNGRYSEFFITWHSREHRFPISGQLRKLELFLAGDRVRKPEYLWALDVQKELKSLKEDLWLHCW